MKNASSTVQTVALVIIAVVLAFMAMSPEPQRESILPSFTTKAEGAEAAAAARLSWQRLESRSSYGWFHRSKIPGGWLVTVRQRSEPGGQGITFVPDPMHAWDGSSLPTN